MVARRCEQMLPHDLSYYLTDDEMIGNSSYCVAFTMTLQTTRIHDSRYLRHQLRQNYRMLLLNGMC